MKKILAVSSILMYLLFTLAGCGGGSSGSADAGGGGNNTPGEVVKATVTIDFNTASSPAKTSAAIAAAVQTLLYTHFDILTGFINASKTVNITLTSTINPANVVFGTATVVNGTVTSVSIPAITVDSYFMKVSVVTVNSTEVFSNTSTIDITANGANTFTPTLTIAPDFPVVTQITGFPARPAPANYPVIVTQTLVSGATSVSTVSGAYSPTLNTMVFTPRICSWPDYAVKLNYSVPSFGVPVNGDQLAFDILAILTAPMPTMSAAYHQPVNPTVTIGLPTLADLGMDLATTAGFWASAPGLARANRTTGTGMVNVLLAGANTDVMLTLSVNAVIGDPIPVSFACSGNANPIEISLVQAGVPYTQYVTTPITTSCGNPNPATPFVLMPTASGPAKIEFRFGGVVGNYDFGNMSL